MCSSSPAAECRRWWARVGDLEHDGVEHYLHVTEKRDKKRRKILLDAARAVGAYVERAAIGEDREGPFTAEELHPYCHHPLPADQERALRRRRVMRRARSSKQRQAMLQELEQQCLDGS